MNELFKEQENSGVEYGTWIDKEEEVVTKNDDGVSSIQRKANITYQRRTLEAEPEKLSSNLICLQNNGIVAATVGALVVEKVVSSVGTCLAVVTEDTRYIMTVFLWHRLLCYFPVKVLKVI